MQFLLASVLQTTYDTFLALQLFLQRKISSKTVAEKLTSHLSLSILNIIYDNYNILLYPLLQPCSFACKLAQCEYDVFLSRTVPYQANHVGVLM